MALKRDISGLAREAWDGVWGHAYPALLLEPWTIWLTPYRPSRPRRRRAGLWEPKGTRTRLSGITDYRRNVVEVWAHHPQPFRVLLHELAHVRVPYSGHGSLWRQEYERACAHYGLVP